jgi:outer membrane lipoprotein-sorting protein
MKKLISLLLVVVVIVGCVALAACGGDDGAAVDNGGATNGASQPAGDGGGGGDGAGNGGGGGDSLADILGLGAGINSVYYETVTTAPDSSTFTIQVWMKGNKVRTETEAIGGQPSAISIVDFDAGVQFLYMPDLNIAYRMVYNQEAVTSLTETQSITDYDYTELGTETVDGKVCLVVEYRAGGNTVKTWIWKEHGFPIRTETTTAQGTTVVEFKNIDFSNIPDSMFLIPQGVQIIDQ